MTVQYNPAQLTIIGTLVKWKGTILPLVFRTPGFWLFIVFHTVLTVLKGTDAVEFVPINFTVIASVMGLLVFFIVFYGSQCYSRMQMFFGHCVGLSGTAPRSKPHRRSPCSTGPEVLRCLLAAAPCSPGRLMPTSLLAASLLPGRPVCLTLQVPL